MNTPKTPTEVLTQVIGRDASPVLKLTPPDFPPALVSFEVKGLKLINSLIRCQTGQQGYLFNHR